LQKKLKNKQEKREKKNKKKKRKKEKKNENGPAHTNTRVSSSGASRNTRPRPPSV
jgi:hypothetical protein